MSRSTLVAIISLTALSVALVLGVAVVGVGDSTTPFITTILGFVALTIAQIVGTNKAEKTEATVNELNKDLRNGTFERLVREALTKIAEDPATNLHITQERRNDDGGQSL